MRFKHVVFGLTLVLLLSVIVTDINATETRVITLGGVGYFIKDNSNVFVFPGAISLYQDQFIAELRTKNTTSTYTVGTHLGFDNKSVIGIYLNRPILVTPTAGVFQQVILNNSTDLLFGMPFGVYDIGARFSFGFDGFEDDMGDTDTSNDVKESASYMSLGAGVSNETMDIGFSFDLPSMKREVGDNDVTWGGTGIGINARMFMGNPMKLVPLFVFNTGSASFEYGAGDSTIDYSNMMLGFGAGINYQINEESMLILGFEAFSINKSIEEDKLAQDKLTTTTTTMPGIYMGAESKLSKWLTARIGAAQVFQTTVDKSKLGSNPETKQTSKASNYDVTFGLGINYGDLTLDLSINEGLIFDGPNFISGTTERVSNRLSLTYNF